MTFYFDPNHPTKLLTALESIYSLDRNNQNRFKQYDSTEYGKEEANSVFFFVDDAKNGLEHNTMHMAEEGYTVVAIKFSPKKRYVPFNVADAVLKMWSRVQKVVLESSQPRLFKYHYQSDLFKQVSPSTNQNP